MEVSYTQRLLAGNLAKMLMMTVALEDQIGASRCGARKKKQAMQSLRVLEESLTDPNIIEECYYINDEGRVQHTPSHTKWISEAKAHITQLIQRR